jgi:hypothetical protein
MAVWIGLLTACGGGGDPSAVSSHRTTAETVPAATTDATTTVPAATPPPTTEVATTQVATTEVATTVVDTTAPPAVSTLAALPVETAAEQAALDAAATTAGRGWALADPTGVAQAVGDPFLIGYRIRLDDGVTQHQFEVDAGVVVPSFGVDSTVVDISSPLTDAFLTAPPETARQQAAIDAAIAWLAPTVPGATNGGLLAYRVAFPAVATFTYGMSYPIVAVFTVPFDPAAPFASGSAEIR